MKTVIRISSVILFFALILSFCAVQADSKDDLRYITVTGDAEIKVVPDEIVISLGVQTNDKNLNTAKDENDKIVRQVLAITKKYGIDQKQVQTSRINIEPKYRYYNNQKTFEGYFVSKTIVITLKDISKFEDLFSACLETGVNNVYGVAFQTTELRKYRDKARIMAIKAAYEKAKALAGELDQKIGKPYMIQENAVNRYYGARAQNVMASEGSGQSEDTLAPGEITVNASVTVKFELE
ncbi:MAG: SIMPL domain-containing protein [Armatimonadota bacterium]